MLFSIVSGLLLLWAPPQTRINPNQIVWPPQAVPVVPLILTDGTLRYAGINPPLQVTCPASGLCQITASGFSLNPVEALTRNADGTWQLARVPTGTVIVVRNGLIMLETVDYTRIGQVVTFTAAQGTLSTDTVTAIY